MKVLQFLRMRVGILPGLALCLFALLLAVAVPNTASADPIRVAFVYEEQVSSAGWTYAHDQGRQWMEEQVGDQVEGRVVEGVPEVEVESVMDTLASQGYDVIFGTTFGFMDPMMAVAERHPDTIFMHCSGFKTRENMATYYVRQHQAHFLTGLVAGIETESDHVGFVAAHPIPVVLANANAFALGVQKVNPDAQINVVWTNTWYDPGIEREAASSLIDLGADVIGKYQATPGVISAAEDRGVYAIGAHTDWSDHAPDNVLTSAVWHWGPYYTNQVQNVIDGEWETHQYWGGMEDDVVGIAPLADFVSDESREVVEEYSNRIESGDWEVFTGPLRNQEGELIVEDGDVLSDEKIQSMDWFVEGIEGSL
jgi:basic membrane protein A